MPRTFPSRLAWVDPGYLAFTEHLFYIDKQQAPQLLATIIRFDAKGALFMDTLMFYPECYYPGNPFHPHLFHHPVTCILR